MPTINSFMQVYCAQRARNRVLWPDCRHDGARGFASGHRRRHQAGHGIPCAVVRCAARLLPYLIFFSAAVFVFSLLSFLRPPLPYVFGPERRMSDSAVFVFNKLIVFGFIINLVQCLFPGFPCGNLPHL
jgi:hypothetical protein